jgi:GDPmannose 4,6-dehydratase
MKALITGITGQDGRYLAKHLLDLNYEVYGLVSGQNNPKANWLKENLSDVKLVNGDLRDFSSLVRALEISSPDEVYNLGAISFVALSWSQAELVGEATGLGVLRLLEAIRIHGSKSGTCAKFYQASSSEMFGKVIETPQNEKTPFHPRSPYGVAKVFGHQITVNYRESYGMFACSGILFNHESPLRGDEFVTKKVCKAVAEIQMKKRKTIKLGNLESSRDWGFAGDYVKAMHLMLQQPEPEDFVIATGEAHTVRELCDVAFSVIGISNWDNYVELDNSLIRPAEVDLLLGDYSKAKKKLMWSPTVNFEKLITDMVEFEIRSITN